MNSQKQAILMRSLLCLVAVASISLAVVGCPMPGSSQSTSTTTTTTNTTTPGGYATGTEPLGTVVSPNGSFLYVANYGSNTISAFSIAQTGQLSPLATATVATGSHPQMEAVTSAGTFLYVANYSDNTLSAYAIGASGSLTSLSNPTFATGSGPRSIAMTPNGSFLYVSNQISNSISAYSIASSGLLTPLGTFSTGSNPVSLAVTPNGTYLYVCNYGNGAGNTVSAYSISANGSLAPLATPTFTTGTGPRSVAITPNGSCLYVANDGSNTVSAFSIGAGGALSQIASAYATGTNPTRVVITPNGSYLYASNYGANTLSEYSIAKNGLLTPLGTPTVSSGSQPTSPVFTPNGSYLYVANYGDNTASAYSVGSNGTLTALAASQSPSTYTVAYNSNGAASGNVPVDSNAYAQGATVTVLGNTGALMKTGFSFAGWSTQANGSGATYSQGNTFTMGSANVTLYALWSSASSAHSVTYNGNGATGGNVPVDPTTYVQGAMVTVLGNTGALVKTGFSFAGWNTQANGSGTTYTQGTTFTMGSANVTLYAQWASTSGTITTIAGNGTSGNTASGVPATSTELFDPSGLAFDSAGNLYIAESNQLTTSGGVVAKVSTSGTITVVAGGGTSISDGVPATTAYMAPFGVTVDASGNLYIADPLDDWVRKVTSGTITTFAGNGLAIGYSGDGGPARSAGLYDPYGITIDANGNIYIVDNNNARIRKVNTSGIITTVAGNGTWGYAGDGGPATSAELRLAVNTFSAIGLTVDSAGNLYIADRYNNVVRKVSKAGTITTVAGNGYGAGTGIGGYTGDGGPATNAELGGPTAVAVDSSGNLFIADGPYHVIRKVNSAGIITTIAGNGKYGYTGDGGFATSAELGNVDGLALDASGSLFISDSSFGVVRKVVSP